MRKTLGIATLSLTLAACGNSNIDAVETTSTTTTIPMLEALDAPPTTMVVSDVQIYLAIRKADSDAAAERAARSARRKEANRKVQQQRDANRKSNGVATASVNNPQPMAGGDIWRALASCESGDGKVSVNPNAVSPSGRYFGAFQFSLATWRSVGETGKPTDYSYEHQLSAAKRLQARSGWGQWPTCSKRLGLR